MSTTADQIPYYAPDGRSLGLCSAAMRATCSRLWVRGLRDGCFGEASGKKPGLLFRSISRQPKQAEDRLPLPIRNHALPEGSKRRSHQELLKGFPAGFVDDVPVAVPDVQNVLPRGDILIDRFPVPRFNLKTIVNTPVKDGHRQPLSTNRFRQVSQAIQDTQSLPGSAIILCQQPYATTSDKHGERSEGRPAPPAQAPAKRRSRSRNDELWSGIKQYRVMRSAGITQHEHESKSDGQCDPGE